MSKIVSAFLLMLTLACSASAQLLTTGAGCQPGVCGATGYQGPGDVVSGATAFYGLRSYNAAYATGSNNAINVRRASDNTTQNIVILSNGNLDTATAATFAGTDATASCTIAGTSAACTGASATIHVNDPVSGTGLTQPCIVAATNGSTTATVEIAGTTTSCGTVGVAETLTFQVAIFGTEMYDQTGNGNHATQATAGTQPQILLSCINSKPCMGYNGSQELRSGTLSNPVTQPFTTAWVAARINSIAVEKSFSWTGNQGSGWANSATTLELYNGASLQLGSVSDNTMHSVQMVGNGASSAIYSDNVGTTGNSGSSTTGTIIDLGNNVYVSNPQWLTGYQSEAGFWLSAFNSTQASSMCHNQYTYWGTATSC